MTRTTVLVIYITIWAIVQPVQHISINKKKKQKKKKKTKKKLLEFLVLTLKSYRFLYAKMRQTEHLWTSCIKKIMCTEITFLLLT